MKIWLDDEFDARKDWFPVSDGWIHCRWPLEVIGHLQTGTVTDMSLDHDLGEGNEVPYPRTGYDVIRWLENEVGFERWKQPLPRISFHSQNPEGKRRMEQGLKQIMRMIEKRT